MIEIDCKNSCFDKQFKTVYPNKPHQVAEDIKAAFSISSDALVKAQQAILAHRSVLVFRNSFLVDENELPPTPVDFVPIDNPSWWLGSNVAIALASQLDLKICSYQSENDGKAFVNLVKMPESKGLAKKSMGSMRGHTDAVAHPLPGEGDGTKSPSPDYVVLICLRSNETPTRFCSLDNIVEALSEEHIDELTFQQFLVKPQKTFDPNAIDTLSNVCLMREEPAPMAIRFSHSMVKVDKENSNYEPANLALDALQSVISENMEDVVLNPGDIAFINNRTALHGRGEVGGNETRDRWLMRAYAMHEDRDVVQKSKDEPHILLP